MKLKLKNGNEQWVYIHIEVQGSYDKPFAKGMSIEEVAEITELPISDIKQLKEQT